MPTFEVQISGEDYRSREYVTMKVEDSVDTGMVTVHFRGAAAEFSITELSRVFQAMEMMLRSEDDK